MNKNKQPQKKLGALSISSIDPAAREAFAKLAKDSNMTQGQLLTLILNNYQNLSVEFSEEESATIRQAKNSAPDTFKKKVKKAVLRYAKGAINMKDSPSTKTVDINVKNSARAADVRADAFLTKIFKHNNQANNWYDKILLTKSSILDYVEKQRKLEPKTICIGKVVLDRCLERNKKLIQNHHEDHKLNADHNVKAHYERLKITKGVNL